MRPVLISVGIYESPLSSWGWGHLGIQLHVVRFRGQLLVKQGRALVNPSALHLSGILYPTKTPYIIM